MFVDRTYKIAAENMCLIFNEGDCALDLEEEFQNFKDAKWLYLFSASYDKVDQHMARVVTCIPILQFTLQT